MSKVLVDRELLPCPFCGQQEAFVEQLDSDASVVICQGMVDEHSACLARGPVGVQQSDMEDQPGKDAAISEWNRRAQSAEADGPSFAEVLEQASVIQQLGAKNKRIDELQASLSAVTAERDRLESMLIRTATRHFALQIKDRADDKKLDECLSEGIAMLEAERDQYRAEVEALLALLGKSLPVVEAHAGASHMLEGFRPTRNKWDELVDGIRAAMAAKEG